MTTVTPAPEIKDQAAILLGQVAGYTGHRTVGIGLRSGLVRALADAATGATADDLAARTGHDPFYVGVWCRSAFAGGVCERDGDTYRLAPHMATLLLDESSPAYAGGIFAVFEQHELFDRFEQALGTGERLWWNDCSPAWIDGVSKSGRPFYTRLVPGGLEQIPGLAQRLADGGVIVDTGCGAGLGLVRLAEHYPACELIGVDGDAHSIELARRTVEKAGLADRVRFVTEPLEEFTIDRPATLVVNNITMHECRDIDRVTQRVVDALEPGGLFVISDFPFPDDDEALATVPGRVMAGIQFFEAQIDDQLLPRRTYDALLQRHGFTDLGTASLTPVHALTWGRV
ncbi:methyltransferase family protein [Haloactinopolyspora alba]|uniref:Methyltransferase family protein n=1 Tax=Haloactinopolyspora alba TaxID=648780 RepID=A0A2P8E584_9ACTN|nr:methyltransferase family protein [Haloactinopolyspora alba]